MNYKKGKKPVTKQEGYGIHLCRPCNVVFSTQSKLMEHKAEKRAVGAPKHIHCRFCYIDFVTIEAEAQHVKLVHAQAQHLECPGCGRGPFSRLAQLFSHVESNECHITIDKMAEVQEQKTDFARKLVAATGQPIKHDFSAYLPRKNDFKVDVWSQAPENPKVFEGRVQEWPGLPSAFASSSKTVSGGNKQQKVVDKIVESSGSVYIGETVKETLRGKENVLFDFAGLPIDEPSAPIPSDAGSQTSSLPPHLRRKATPSESGPQTSNSTLPPHLRRTQQSPATQRSAEEGSSRAPLNAWGQKQNLFPKAPTSQRPTQHQLKTATEPGQRMLYEAMDPSHPSHPNFNAAKYYCSIMEKFTCPNVSCVKSFKTAGALIAHLLSPIHGDTTYHCPCCLGRFKTLVSMVAHCESTSQKCMIRETKDYAALMDQLTAGMVDVSLEALEDGSKRYEIPESAKVAFGRGGGLKKGKGKEVVKPKKEFTWMAPNDNVW